MKRLYILCFLAIAAVFIDIALFHTRAVRAQNPTLHEVQRVRIDANPKPFNTSGTVVGFSCFRNSVEVVECYVATK